MCSYALAGTAVLRFSVGILAKRLTFSLRKAIALLIRHALRLRHPARRPHDVFVSNPFESLTFLLQPKKVSKKGRSPGYVLHPIIFEI
ncbi:MAG: hypothetical protein ACJAWT_001680 [Glaciecola sp.]